MAAFSQSEHFKIREREDPNRHNYIILIRKVATITWFRGIEKAPLPPVEGVRRLQKSMSDGRCEHFWKIQQATGQGNQTQSNILKNASS